ncbi:hypothetical protein LguiB_033152 [Lonicera macranthoides]
MNFGQYHDLNVCRYHLCKPSRECHSSSLGTLRFKRHDAIFLVESCLDLLRD